MLYQNLKILFSGFFALRILQVRAIIDNHDYGQEFVENIAQGKSK